MVSFDLKDMPSSRRPNPGAMLRGKPSLQDMDFNTSPFIVFWEVTRACDLACIHCRAEAIPYRHPQELKKGEGFRLLDQIREFGKPLCVLTGGDPMERPDILEFIRYGDDLGLRMALTPSGTKGMTREVVQSLKDAGLSRLAISLDGSTPEAHDAFRQVEGSYGWTMGCIEHAHQVGLPLQINTTMTRHNLCDFDELAGLMTDLNIVLWAVFFLVPTGRARQTDDISATEYEWVLIQLFKLSLEAPFDIKTTEAPHYRRVVLQRMKEARRNQKSDRGNGRRSFLNVKGGPGFTVGDAIGRASNGVNDGKGCVFISHTGDVYPSGFLPISGGNVRHQNLAEIYRNTSVFQKIRDYSMLKGKCGVCEYKNICGGSRSRAYGTTGDFMESDPCCVYIPKGAEAYAGIIQ